jgi:hypothetical protein
VLTVSAPSLGGQAHGLPRAPGGAAAVGDGLHIPSALARRSERDLTDAPAGSLRTAGPDLVLRVAVAKLYARMF